MQAEKKKEEMNARESKKRKRYPRPPAPSYLRTLAPPKLE